LTNVSAGLELLTAAQMRAIESAAMASGRATGLDLMEYAGRGVVAAIWQEWPELAAGPHRAVVLCGPGGNGGDGYVIARHLDAAGWTVAVHALAPPATPDAAEMARRWGGAARGLADLSWQDLAHAPLVVDAVFGTGLARPIASGIRDALEMARASGCRIVAVDLPSGLCSDSGRVLAEGAPEGWPADLTVTFERARLGHVLAEGPALCGRLAIVPLGLGRELAALSRTGGLVERAKPVSDLGKRTGHKFAHGHALVLAGGPGTGGAARLAARGALRVGAGLVTLAPPPEALAENAARLDAVMLRPVADAAALAEVLKDARITALCLGPGLGLRDETRSLLATALDSGRPMVLDADALTLIGRDATLFAALHRTCVLTPHGGEFARLFPDIAAKLAAPATKGPAWSKVDATREAAARAGCTVLFKGADTVIASPDGTCAVNSAAYDRAAPWLATAGSGDVLAGFIAGLLARGFGPRQAAETGAWLHVECARSFGPGLIAEDLPEELPEVFRALGM
jgi:hydroxyethylthiazole kinase-like uncharacterized protein yjeF